MNDYVSISRLATLHPQSRFIFQNFIEECELTLGISLRITSALREFDVQDELYQQGRSTSGKIVTYARAGQSWHNYGLAIDLVKLSGTVVDYTNTPYKEMSGIAKKYEIEWGGDFAIKNFNDVGHFQYRLKEKLSLIDAQQLYYSRCVDEEDYIIPNCPKFQKENLAKSEALFGEGIEENKVNTDISIINNNSSLDTLIKFVSYHNIKMTADELLNYQSNADEVFFYYTQQERKDYGAANSSLLKLGTRIVVPRGKVDRQFLITHENVLFKNEKFTAFLAEKLKEIQNNPGFKPISEYTYQKSIFSGSKIAVNESDIYHSISKQINYKSVWIWCKALGENGQLIDVTPFIENITTSVTATGGSFSLSLAPVTAEFKNGQLQIKELNYKIYEDENNQKSFIFKDSIVTEGLVTLPTQFQQELNNSPELIDGLKSSLVKNKFFFNLALSENDVVFIQFEKLEMEGDRNESDPTELDINKAALNDKNFDMIGLISSNNISYSPGGTDVNIMVSGGDLMKLLLEDGTFFFPLEYGIKDPQGIFKNYQDLGRSILRLAGDGSLDPNIFNAFVAQNISTCLTFIINQLSNIQISSDDLFNGYPTSKKRYITKTKGNGTYENALAAGIWQIVHLLFDDSIKDRILVDASIATDSGSLYNYVQKVCQKPFVEFFGDTYGDMYYFTVRKPPFTYDSFKNLVDIAIDINEEDVLQEQLDFDTEVYSWFHLIPNGTFFGNGTDITLNYLPAIFLPEYCEIWGSRPLEIVTNYINWNAYDHESSKTKTTLQNVIDQCENDLEYLIESFAYLPFTRKGTIAIKGDRRIKRGTAVRLISTGEVFYVEGVTNSFSVSTQSTDRYTALQLSRGVVEKHLSSYFKIVNLKKYSRNTTPIEKENQWKVNQDIFKFFIKRQQFA